MQKLSIAEDNDQEGEDETKDEETQDVGDVVCGFGGPVHRAGCPRTFEAIPAPAEKRGYCPRNGITPRDCNSHANLPEVGGICLGAANHCAVALI